MAKSKIIIDDDGELHNDKGMSTPIKVALISFASAIIVAIVGAIPVGSNKEPLACGFSGILQGIYACGDVTIINGGNLPPTPNNETQVAMTLTAIASSQVTPTIPIEKQVEMTLTAIASQASPIPTNAAIPTKENNPTPHNETQIIHSNSSTVVCTGIGNQFTETNHPTDAPPEGCVLIVEWWIPPLVDADHCGTQITNEAPTIPEGSIGTWWYVYPNRPDSHIREYLQKSPNCTIDDLR